MGLLGEPNSLLHVLSYFLLFLPTMIGGLLIPIGLLRLTGWMTTGNTVENPIGERPEYRSRLHRFATFATGFVCMLASGVVLTVVVEGVLFAPSG